MVQAVTAIVARVRSRRTVLNSYTFSPRAEREPLDYLRGVTADRNTPLLGGTPKDHRAEFYGANGVTCKRQIPGESRHHGRAGRAYSI